MGSKSGYAVVRKVKSYERGRRLVEETWNERGTGREGDDNKRN